MGKKRKSAVESEVADDTETSVVSKKKKQVDISQPTNELNIGSHKNKNKHVNIDGIESNSKSSKPSTDTLKSKEKTNHKPPSLENADEVDNSTTKGDDFDKMERKRKKKEKKKEKTILIGKEMKENEAVTDEQVTKHQNKKKSDSKMEKLLNSKLKKIQTSQNTSTVTFNEPSNTVETETEDPEKAAIKEKKKEKRKQKKLAKQQAKKDHEDRSGTAKDASLEYLQQWENKRSEWKFMKVRQVWLLHNMFDLALVDDSSFEILLRYLEPLKGKSRETTVTAAEKIIKDLEDIDDTEDDQNSRKEDRAKQVIQLLSD